MDCEVVVIELGCEYDLRSEDERAPSGQLACLDHLPDPMHRDVCTSLL